MSRSGQPPDLNKYMDKQLQIKLNANRMGVGTVLRGFDKTDIGMVVYQGK